MTSFDPQLKIAALETLRARVEGLPEADRQPWLDFVGSMERLPPNQHADLVSGANKVLDLYLTRVSGVAQLAEQLRISSERAEEHLGLITVLRDQIRLLELRVKSQQDQIAASREKK